MRLVWYTSGLCAPFPSLNCQILTVLSHPPLTNSIPVGLHSQLVTALEWALYICVGLLRCLTSNVYRLWSSDARRRSVGSVGDQDRDVDWKCMTTRRSALDVRISYRVNVRSEPHDAIMEVSAGLNLRAVMVSTEVWKVRLEIDDVLQWKEQCHPKLIWNIGR